MFDHGGGRVEVGNNRREINVTRKYHCHTFYIDICHRGGDRFCYCATDGEVAGNERTTFREEM